MALTAALKAQIGAWYKALQQQIPDFIPRAPQRQMIADVAKTLAGDDGRHLAIEAPTGVGKTLSYLIPGIAIAREEQKTLVVSTANVALQDQIFSKDLPLLRKIIPDLRFTAAFTAVATSARVTWRRSPAASLRNRICWRFLMMN